MKKITVLIVILLIFSLSVSGCYNPKTVMVIDDYEITAGTYLLLQLRSALDAAGRFPTGENIKLLFDEEIDGVDFREWIKEETLRHLKDYVFIEREFENKGLTIDKTLMLTYEYGIQNDWKAYSGMYLNNGISYTSLYKLTENQVKRLQLFDSIYVDEGAEKKVGDDEIKEYFVKNYGYMDSIRIRFTDEAGNPLPDEKKAEIIEWAKSTAEKINSEYPEDSETSEIESVFELYLDYAYPDRTLNETEIQDLRDNMLSKSMPVSSSSANYEKALIDKFLDTEDNVVTAFEGSSSIYIFKRSPMLVSGDEYKNYSQEIIQIIRADEFEEYVKKGSENYIVDADEKAKNYYNIDKINLYGN
ncbi:MAG: hypothetical protein GX222_08385 [Ruminococcaceae bacterium]|mgnify:CR=1 FL=1|nr:hypothetical protein [Oscillospiraceae bacterium]